jgi:hypothetical protein
MPETTIVYSGSKSAKLSILNPVDDTRRRLEILNDLDTNITHSWFEAWYYIPENMYPFNPSEWLSFHRAIYERLWDDSLPLPYQYFQISIGVYCSDKSSSLGEHFFHLGIGKGTVDNDDDGVIDWDTTSGSETRYNLHSNDDPESNPNLARILVPFGRWFKVTTYVTRNPDNFEDGKIKVWIDDELLWDLSGVRTIGIDPEKISDRQGFSNPRAYLSCGFSLYRQVGATPSTIYVDEVIIRQRA